jgi:formate hydrogenlyase regulatory protein HycA
MTIVSAMPVPEVIPIAHEPDYRTATIGKFDDGQFLASVTWAYREGYTRSWGPPNDHKRIYAVLHTFDAEGHHLDSNIWHGGTYTDQLRLRDSSAGDDPLTRAQTRLDRLLDALPGRAYTDIAIRPFQVVFDGTRFGLVVEQHDEEEREDNWAELYPDRLGFHEPWNGLYDT